MNIVSQFGVVVDCVMDMEQPFRNVCWFEITNIEHISRYLINIPTQSTVSERQTLTPVLDVSSVNTVSRLVIQETPIFLCPFSYLQFSSYKQSI